MEKNFNSWVWFALNNQEELFSVISELIEAKVKEILPQLVEEQLRQRLNSFSFDIQTTINGKPSVDIKDIIANMIIKQLC